MAPRKKAQPNKEIAPSADDGVEVAEPSGRATRNRGTAKKAEPEKPAGVTKPKAAALKGGRGQSGGAGHGRGRGQGTGKGKGKARDNCDEEDEDEEMADTQSPEGGEGMQAVKVEEAEPVAAEPAVVGKQGRKGAASKHAAAGKQQAAATSPSPAAPQARASSASSPAAAAQPKSAGKGKSAKQDTGHEVHTAVAVDPQLAHPTVELPAGVGHLVLQPAPTPSYLLVKCGTDAHKLAADARLAKDLAARADKAGLSPIAVRDVKGGRSAATKWQHFASASVQEVEQVLAILDGYRRRLEHVDGVIVFKRKLCSGSWLEDVRGAVEVLSALRFCAHMSFSHLTECVEFGDAVVAYIA